LLRIAVVWNIPVACNRASADFIITSTLMTEPYERFIPTYNRVATSARSFADRGITAEVAGILGKPVDE